MPRIDLRTLILLLAASSALMTFLHDSLSGYQAQRQQLMEHTLEANRAYAATLAYIGQSFFGSIQDQLAYSADQLAEHFDDPVQREAEVERLFGQSDSFNTVLVVGADGVILASSKDTRALLGQVLASAGARQALTQRQPLVSQPYVGANGESMVFISHPIYQGNRYRGYIGGAIYLQQPNAFYTLLGRHHHRDGSYLYVVDGKGRLIYHPDRQRVGEDISQNPAVQAALNQRDGQERITDTSGVDMLAGYAHISAAGWGVVVQRPTAIILHELGRTSWRRLSDAIPFALFWLFALWWLSGLIARPLQALASTAEALDAEQAPRRIERVRGWYFEALRLKQAMLAGVLLVHQKVGRLNQESITDPLTGLTNRRGMQLALEGWEAARQPFAVLALDIDTFKAINDSFGHDTGDAVLRFLAEHMRRNARTDDLLCRVGGEEFLMLLPGVGYREALGIAERLRRHLALTPSPTGQPITVSIGVAHCPELGDSVASVLKQADRALYAAKHAGRNRVHGGEALPA